MNPAQNVDVFRRAAETPADRQAVVGPRIIHSRRVCLGVRPASPAMPRDQVNSLSRVCVCVCVCACVCVFLSVRLQERAQYEIGVLRNVGFREFRTRMVRIDFMDSCLKLEVHNLASEAHGASRAQLKLQYFFPLHAPASCWYLFAASCTIASGFPLLHQAFHCMHQQAVSLYVDAHVFPELFSEVFSWALRWPF